MTFLKARGWPGLTFPTCTSPRTSNKTLIVSPSSAFHGGECCCLHIKPFFLPNYISMVLNALHSSRYSKRHLWRTQLRALSLNQLGWFNMNMNDPNVTSRNITPLFETDRGILHTCSMNPCQPGIEWCLLCFVFDRYLFVLKIHIWAF